MSDWNGKTALVSGAADGIGAALCEVLVDSGARVYACDLNAEKLEATAERIGMGWAPCDVSDAVATAGVVDRAWSELGTIDLVCANAGVLVPGSVLEATSEDIEFIFGVNVWGALNLVRPVVEKLRSVGRLRASGRSAGEPPIVHALLTGSEHSLANPSYLRAAPLHLYNMTKHAVLSLGESLRAELEPEGLGVSVLCPGPVESGLAENSEKVRPAHLGAQRAVDFSRVDQDVLANLGALYMPARRAAEIALGGLQKGAFVIPTHGFQKEDVDARSAEIHVGFDLLD